MSCPNHIELIRRLTERHRRQLAASGHYWPKSIRIETEALIRAGERAIERESDNLTNESPECRT